MTQHIVCVWLGKFTSKDFFYNNYLAFDYEDQDDTIVSPFGKDAGLRWYDEDFIESCWRGEMTMSELQNSRTGLLDSDHFFDDLLVELRKVDLSDFNTITFLFGDKNGRGVNTDLFDYDWTSAVSPLRFVMKKVYEK